MCLIFLAYEQHREYRLVVAANRDEDYERPTATAAYWPDHPQVLAGRDLEAGGTWMGVNTAGRFAALTNVRSARPPLADPPSRGGLTTGFLTAAGECERYLRQVEATADAYNGFSLLLDDTRGLHYFSNFEATGFRRLRPGLYGLSNHLLDTPWPKVEQGKYAIGEWVGSGDDDIEPLFDIMARKARAPDEALPETGVDKDFERALSALFIESPGYGTRSTSIVLVGYDGTIVFTERTFEPGSDETTTVRHELVVNRSAFGRT